MSWRACANNHVLSYSVQSTRPVVVREKYQTMGKSKGEKSKKVLLILGLFKLVCLN